MTALRWRIKSLATWPYPDTPARRSLSVFRASWQDTLRLLREEADRVGAVEPIALQLVCDPADLRADGMLRARANVPHPGVILTLTTATGPLVFATDQYEQRQFGTLCAWQANVRAIALGMEALRAVDRYGITRRAEQYAGFRALEAGTSHPFRNAAEARTWLAAITGLPATSPATELLGAAKRRCHPDANGGDHSDWDHVAGACGLLDSGRAP